jgi:AAA domain, putative AbiEii toxin, Type IV TA system
MLSFLGLNNVGPAPELKMQLGSRLNVITGDNGLGKSFLLEVAWWALTQTWLQEINPELTSGYAPRPTASERPARISFERRLGPDLMESGASEYKVRQQSWPSSLAHERQSKGLALHVLADGGFAVWDSLRNADGYKRTPTTFVKAPFEDLVRLPAYVFGAKDVWGGRTMIVDGKPTIVCNGLLADWASWIRERGADAQRMEAVLAKLAPTLGADAIRVSPEFARLSLNDVRDIPMLRMGYGQDVPVLYASLGVRRVAALAYIMSWAWREHVIAAKQLGERPASQMVVLFDELEAHLHPRWQRAIAPALLDVVHTLTGDASAQIQLIATTHSPLVLASLEPLFDESTDRLFTLEQIEEGNQAGQVILREQPWAKQGDVVNWLVSDAFGLKQGRSLEAERAIEAAEAWMRDDHAALPAKLKTKHSIHAELLRTLAGHDDFWPRWIVTAKPERPGRGSEQGPARRAPSKRNARGAAAKKTGKSRKAPARPVRQLASKSGASRPVTKKPTRRSKRR